MSNLNETIVKETFGSIYNRDKFARFARELLNGIQDRGTTHVQIPSQFKDYIQSYYRIGKYVYNDGFEKIIDVLEVKLKRNSSIEHARAMQRNFVARYLNGAFGDIKRDAALVAFISEDTKDWRFSFVKMDYKSQIITQENGKQKRIIEKELTPAKRFSFLVGENEDIHTAQKQLFDCLSKASSGKQITLEDLVEAFDIEKVSKEFFAEYKKLYTRLRDELKRIYDFDVKIHKDFDDHDINIDDFAKKTMGQLVFLYFVQKKGWLGVKSGETWGSGDKRFLRNLFDKKYVKYDNFFNDILEPLFYRALARDRGNENDNFAPLNCRIPFLNGGLFEPINGYGYAQTDLTIDNAVFKEIFDVFDLYNFTVKEDEPLEKEVAIDPEMLGKVFENLLPENERKGNGAFYTPREIVHYMCQESLINYLYNAVNTEKLNLSQAQQGTLIAKKKLKQADLELEKFEEIVSKEDISTFIKLGESTYTNSNRGINEDLPSSIKENAVKINQALKDVKICDPAIGSGAFPVGMMNEIVRARLALGVENKSAYQIKREIIENNLYGVDLDDGAVEIAKLRFWLSLIVDEEDISNIKPLPNLDYKVMQGNSLITSYEGINFDEIVENYKPKAVQLDFDYYGSSSDNIIKNINSDMYDYIKASHDIEKQEIRNKIEQGIVNLVRSKVEEKAKQGGIQWDKAEQTIRDFAQNRKHRNFFPWKLFFADVFMNGGFDIVIGNPPYIKEYTERGAFDGLRSSPYYQGKMDLWYFFGCKGLDILKPHAIETYIAPNNWTTNAGASKFRNKVLREAKIINFVDFGNYKVFDTASIQTMVYLLNKNSDNSNYQLYFSKLINDNITKNELEEFLSQNSEGYNYIKYVLNFNNSAYINKFITFLEIDKNSLITKIQSGKNIYLSNKEMTNGIHPHHDKVNKKMLPLLPGHEVGEGIFVLDETELLKITENDKSLIRPYYTSNELFKYYASKINHQWIIYTDSTFKNINKIKQYPSIKSHLDQYVDVITSDNKPYGLHRARDERFFNGEKIISLRKCANCPTFTYTDFSCYVGAMYYIIKTERMNMKYLTAILNSSVIAYWLKNQGKMQGNNYQVDKEPLMNIPLHIPSTVEERKVVNVVDEILNLTQSEDYEVNKQKHQLVQKYEDQIDIMVYKLYNLTYSEVLTVDKDFQISEKEYNEYKLD